MSNAAGTAARIAKVWSASAITCAARSAFVMLAVCFTAFYAQSRASDSEAQTQCNASGTALVGSSTNGAISLIPSPHHEYMTETDTFARIRTDVRI